MAENKSLGETPQIPSGTALRYERIELRPPPYLAAKAPVGLSMVHVAEAQAPPGEKPIKWFLLTTMEIASPEAV